MKYYPKWPGASDCIAQSSDSHVLSYQESKCWVHTDPHFKDEQGQELPLFSHAQAKIIWIQLFFHKYISLAPCGRIYKEMVPGQ